MKIIFVLPSAGGGGGAHSIVQETLGLTRLGVTAAVATPRAAAPRFRAQYPELAANNVANPLYGSVQELAAAMSNYQLVIATMALSVSDVVEASKLQGNAKRLKLAYYIQDYEPLFYAPDSPDWAAARQSFQLMEGGLMFAKTDWLCSIVDRNHNVAVQRVQASIDHDTYFPRLRPADEPLRVVAMVRPKTARRAPKRTIRVLEQIVSKMPNVEASFFGCETADLPKFGIRPSESLISLGVLSRSRVAETLQRADLFLDLSDYQAFGRTGLEGMACGCVPVLPTFGGTDEYAQHGLNSYVVDTRSEEQVLAVVDQFANARRQWRLEMRDEAIETALNYSISKAAYSEFKLFRDFLREGT